MKSYLCYYGQHRTPIQAKDRKQAIQIATETFKIPQTCDRHRMLLFLTHDEHGNPTIPDWNISKI